MNNDTPALRRRLGLPLLVLYGTGVTVGAGIYAGRVTVAGHAGKHAPLSFLMAAVVMGLTVASYAELSTRFPVAAGEAAYIKGAFGSPSVHDDRHCSDRDRRHCFSDRGALALPDTRRSSSICPDRLSPVRSWFCLGRYRLGVFWNWCCLRAHSRVIELGGLIAIVVAAAHAGTPIGESLLTLPALTSSAWAGVGFASLLAFFAFIGFEDLTNMIEETTGGERTIPLAMVLTLSSPPGFTSWSPRLR